MRVLVTGGTGFIGSHIVDLLKSNSCEVAVIDNFSSGKHTFDNDIQVYNCDITDKEKTESVFEEFNPQFVIHHAAQVSVAVSMDNPLLDEEINIKGSLNILEASRKNNVEKIVFASTAAVYGNPIDLPVSETHEITPLSPYGLSKYTVENYLKLYEKMYGLKYTILRYSNVFGPRQDAHGEGGVVAIFSDKVSKNKDLKVFGDGEQTRDFIFVKDVALANYLSLTNGDNEIINISSGSSISLNNLISVFSKITKKHINVIYEDSRAGDIKDSTLSNQKAIDMLKWTPEIPLERGLEETINEY